MAESGEGATAKGTVTKRLAERVSSRVTIANLHYFRQFRLSNELMTLMVRVIRVFDLSELIPTALGVDVKLPWYFCIVSRSELSSDVNTELICVSCSPKSDANMFEWAGTLEGPPGSVYERLTFKITLSFPPTYPYTAPNVR